MMSCSKKDVSGGLITHYFINYSNVKIIDTSSGENFRETPINIWKSEGVRTRFKTHLTIDESDPMFNNIIRRIIFERNSNTPYNALTNNCEQTANYIMTGKRESLQVRGWLLFGSLLVYLGSAE